MFVAARGTAWVIVGLAALIGLVAVFTGHMHFGAFVWLLLAVGGFCLLLMLGGYLIDRVVDFFRRLTGPGREPESGRPPDGTKD